ncbi:MAG TPA: hypothetical protein VGK99_07210 [Acidobacteriota bacterium]
MSQGSSNTANNQTLSAAAKGYIGIVIAAGLPLLAFSAYQTMKVTDVRWLYLAAFTVVGSVLAVRVPLMKIKGQSLTISVSDVFVFAALLLFGFHVAVTLAGLEGIASSLRVRVKRAYKQLFNVAELALATYVVGRVFYWMMGRAYPLDPSEIALNLKLLVLVNVAGLLYFALNTAMVALAISLVLGRPFFTIWSRNFAWLSAANILNESTAAIIFAFFSPANYLIIAAVIPVALANYYARRVNLYRMSQANGSHA